MVAMHTGHRSRLAGKIKDGGVVYEHELLEYVLFNACPRRDLNATAHSLIEKFGSISGVLAASREELVSVNGVGENMAEYLLCLGKSLSRCGNCNSFAVLRNTADFKSFISTRATGASDCLELCLMDKDGRVRRIVSFAAQNGGRAEVCESRILGSLSVYRPYGLFACYRHAGDCVLPDGNDDIAAGKVIEVCKLCGVRLYDFCSVKDGEIYSYFINDRLILCANRGK